MTTTQTLTAPHPIIVGAMEQAGTMAQRCARSMQTSGVYGIHQRNQYAMACHLTDALGYDAFGVWRIADSNTSADKGYSVEARRHAAERRDWRTRLSDQIARLDDDAFTTLITIIAADVVAIDAADGYDVAS